MSAIKRALESTDPSFRCSTKIEMTTSDIMLSAEWDHIYERLRDEEEAKARAVRGVNQEVGNANSAFPNQQQEPKPTHLEAYRDV